MKVDILGGVATVNDTFEVRAAKGQFFDIGMAYAAAHSQHPELETITLLNTRYVDSQGRDMTWKDAYAETVWTFELPAPEQPVEDTALGYFALNMDSELKTPEFIPCASEGAAFDEVEERNRHYLPQWQTWVACKLVPLDK